ncbi:hypothetical protein HS088_TW06G00246 [Tripterygium wilfordii]|uniref:Dirigent protein n=1 Tax=Tripterygium wilfordii TaxID=458696 RepID=A0A7J7DI99_TRIWF|nr:dirigent protein 22-like [Tripterygium wilfordii]KAF5746081.1 hypothetical protein HS088_TW06G00246 [Tripterygium wilfordii]
MAPNSSTNLATSVFFFFFFLLLTILVSSTEATKHQFLNLRETNMVFYMQDLQSGANATSIQVGGPLKKLWSFLTFGTVYSVDDSLMAGINRNSTQIGRAHGIFINSALDGSDLHILMSLIFTNKEYNGSTLEIQGADRVYQKYREVSVVSGTGKFRLARGYATLETVNFDIKNLAAIIRWNVTVFHY